MCRSHIAELLLLLLLLLLVVSCSAASFSEALRMGAEVYHNLKNLIKDKYGE
jgi:enolase